MVQEDLNQYKIKRGNAKTSNISATYEYTSGNKTNEKNTSTAKNSTNSGG